MSRRFGGAADDALGRQVEIFGSYSVSLNDLWRSIGEPGGHDPASWVSRAGPLISGYAAYLAEIVDGSLEPVLWIFEGDDGDPWRVGDLMGRGEVAQLYANYLDVFADARRGVEARR